MQSTALPATALPATRTSGWIISPPVDLALLVLTPLAIVPLMAVAAAWLAPETIFLFVVAFASIGHHLPGFMRAYGDRELFRRFQWRFLLAPPLVFLLALAFTLNNLHGLELVLMLWATWHIMMQTFGLMRIYDRKRGINDPLSARLDFLLCAALFLVGIVFSEARVFGMVDTFSRVGMPLPSAAWLPVIRWGTAVAGGIVLLLYGLHAWRIGRTAGVSTLKFLLVVSTAGLFWICGSLSTNMLVGVAMFEIFHALQYYALVWTYNRRLVARVGNRFGSLAFLFQDRWFFVGMYLAAIAAFGSLRLVAETVSDPRWNMVLLALLSTSTLLHFYYDGFIWKVSEKSTGENFNLAGGAKEPSHVAGWAHLAKCATLGAAAVLLMGLESTRTDSTGDDVQRLDRMAAWAPQLPELQIRLSQAALAAGDIEAAVTAGCRAAELRSHSAAAQAACGSAQLQAEDYQAAERYLAEAVRLAPRTWENRFDWAQALAGSGKFTAAAEQFEKAAELAPEEPQVPLAWARMELRIGRRSEALERFERAWELETDFDSRTAIAEELLRAGAEETAIALARSETEHAEVSEPAHRALGELLVKAGRFEEALAEFQQAAALAPQSAECRYQMGLVLVQLGRFGEAESVLDESIKRDSTSAHAFFQLGNVFYSTGKPAEAADRYRQAIALDAELFDAYNNLGAALFDAGDAAGAETAYRTALELAPENGAFHYNLALFLLSRDRSSEARRHLQRAEALGRAIPQDLRQAVGM